MAAGSIRVHPDIVALGSLVRFRDETTYEWAGTAITHDPRRVRPSLFVATADPSVVLEVAQLLYDRGYTRPEDPTGVFIEDRLLRQTFVDRLDAANATKVSWAEGWRLAGEEGEVMVLHGPRGERERVGRDEFRPQGGRAAGRLRLRKGSTAMQMGWYHARGARAHAPSAPGTLRLYWALCRAGAVPLVRTFTAGANRRRIPFHLKVIADPQAFVRADAAVAYIDRADWERAALVIARTHAVVARYLRPETPSMTKALAPGLSIAEDPGNGESFGLHRCRLIAEGLWDGRLASEPSAALTSVEERFRREGLDPTRPHLQGLGEREYQLDLEAAAATGARWTP